MCRNDITCMNVKEATLKSRAEQLFFLMSGFSDANPPTKYQKEDIESVQWDLAQRLQINIYVKPVSEYLFFENYMILDTEQIYYNLPLTEYQNQITGVYVFLISEQTIVNHEQNTLEQLYMHIWQNAYLDAAREWLKDWFGKKYGFFVSQSIAPGFYGIALKDMGKFYNLAGGKQTAVRIREDGMLEPEKSVLGIYLTLTEDINIFGRQCASCLARGKNCEFCMDKL